MADEVWNFLKDERQKVREILKENGVKSFHCVENITNEVDGLLYQAFVLGKKQAIKESKDSP